MNGKYVFVTGANGGMGKATVELLVKQGFYVFAGDLKKMIWDKTIAQNVIPVTLNITDPESIERAVQQISSFTQHLHGLVNIAGVFDQFPLAEARPASFERLVKVNLFGAQFITQALFPLLKEVKGRVVNLSSETVLAQMPLQAYGLSKKFFDVWSTQLRMELKLLDMYVISIRAGGHLTPFIENSAEILGSIDEQSQYANLMRQISIRGQKILKKINRNPIEVAKVVGKTLSVQNPGKTYYVNVSMLYRLLSLIPAGVREKMMFRQFKKWM